MTTRERLHELVEQLDDAAADRLLDAALALAPAAQPDASRGLPAFVGSMRSGQREVATRSEQILRAELGDQAAS